jgi:hypothetical protein
VPGVLPKSVVSIEIARPSGEGHWTIESVLVNDRQSDKDPMKTASVAVRLLPKVTRQAIDIVVDGGGKIVPVTTITLATIEESVVDDNGLRKKINGGGALCPGDEGLHRGLPNDIDAETTTRRNIEDGGDVRWDLRRRKTEQEDDEGDDDPLLDEMREAARRRIHLRDPLRDPLRDHHRLRRTFHRGRGW